MAALPGHCDGTVTGMAYYEGEVYTVSSTDYGRTWYTDPPRSDGTAVAHVSTTGGWVSIEQTNEVVVIHCDRCEDLTNHEAVTEFLRVCTKCGDVIDLRAEPEKFAPPQDDETLRSQPVRQEHRPRSKHIGLWARPPPRERSFFVSPARTRGIVRGTLTGKEGSSSLTSG